MNISAYADIRDVTPRIECEAGGFVMIFGTQVSIRMALPELDSLIVEAEAARREWITDNCVHRFVYVGTGHPPPRRCEECGIDESETL